MLRIIADKKYLKSCVTAVISAVFLLLPILLIGTIPTIVYAAAAENLAPESPPLSYCYQEARAGLSAGYYVEGVSHEWLLYNDAYKTEIIITIPAEYDDTEENDNNSDDDKEDVYEKEFYGKAPVVAIVDFAFAESSSTIYRVVGINFSNAENLEYIGIHAFANSIITDVDLSPCLKLKEIWWGAFFSSIRLRMVEIPGNVSMADGIFEGCKSLEYIITQNKDDYAQYTAMEAMEPYSNLLTYEIEITFDLGDNFITATKLYNLPLSYVKISGQWQKINGSLPDSGFSAGKFGMFASTDGTVINEESNATDSLYKIIWITVVKLEVVTNFPEGFATE